MDTNVVVEGVETFAEVDPFMQLTTMLTFLYIARRGITNQQDIELALGISNAAASRNVLYWTDMKKFNVPGRGFVISEPDPRDRRSKLLRLSPEGKAFYDKLRRKKDAKATA